MTTTNKKRTPLLLKPFVGTFVFVFMFAWALPAGAQHQHERVDAQQANSTRRMTGALHGDMMPGMMQQHMQTMEQMMKDPLQRSAVLVHVLPAMQEPLALSDDQVNRLEQIAQRFGEQKHAGQEKMKQANDRLREILASGDAAPDEVRALLEVLASHHAQMQALAYETASTMKGLLSPDQQTDLAEMKPMQLHHHIMVNMTMMQMMQMMQAMRSEMMPGDMM